MFFPDRIANIIYQTSCVAPLNVRTPVNVRTLNLTTFLHIPALSTANVRTPLNVRTSKEMVIVTDKLGRIHRDFSLYH